MMSLQDFERLLDIYGAERTRWPLAARASAAMRLASDGNARRLLAEADALDSVLDAAPEAASADVAAVASRIMAAVHESVQPAAISARLAPSVVRTGMEPRAVRNTNLWRAASLLAASLIVGIFVGGSPLGADAMPALQQLVGIGSHSIVGQVALADIRIEQIDED